MEWRKPFQSGKIRSTNPLISSCMVYENYRKNNSKKSKNKYERWRDVVKALGLSKQAKNRLEWIIYYRTKGNFNVSLTCRYFGICRSVFYKWNSRFVEYNLRSLESKSTAPKNVRGRKKELKKDERVIKIRKDFMYFGKIKIQTIYTRLYNEDITSWYVQRVIETYNLYPKKRKKQSTKKKNSIVKKKISECIKQPRTGFLLHLDTIVLHLGGVKRYIITAIDEHSKISYARVYKSHASISTVDFFKRLNYVLEGKIENVHTDNGCEFHKHFRETIIKLDLNHWWSRPRTPKDNPSNERFNRTLREEFLNQGNFNKDVDIFNKRITDWLIEYNSIRPHQSLNYLTPLEYAEKTMKLSTMWSSSTLS